MLQRIQSLYMFVSLLLMGILFIYPLFYVQFSAEKFTVFLYKIDPAMTNLKFNVLIPIIIVCVIEILLLFSISLYKNRKLQIRMIQITQLLVLFYIVIIGIYLYKCSGINNEVHIQLTLTIPIPLIAFILDYLAIRGVRKDQALVDSLNRLR
jgi:hypothetical protein